MTERDNSDRTGVLQPPEPKVEQPATSLTFITPSEFIDLPSQGKFYPVGHPLRDKKDIELRYMTAKEEDLLTSKSLLKKGIAIDKVLESLLVEKNLKIEDFIVGDKNALIIAARKSGYGSDYNPTLTCPKCEKKVEFSFDLDLIKNKESKLAEDLQLSPQGTVSVTLPRTKTKIEFRPLTGKDEKRLLEAQEERLKAKQPEAASTTQMRAFIVSVNDNTDRTVVNACIDSMPAFDAKFLRQSYKETVPDVDMTQPFECAKCGHEEVIEVPLTTEFFWPK